MISVDDIRRMITLLDGAYRKPDDDGLTELQRPDVSGDLAEGTFGTNSKASE